MSCRCLQGCLNKSDAACTLPLLSILHRSSLTRIHSWLPHFFWPTVMWVSGANASKGLRALPYEQGHPPAADALLAVPSREQLHACEDCQGKLHLIILHPCWLLSSYTSSLGYHSYSALQKQRKLLCHAMPCQARPGQARPGSRLVLSCNIAGIQCLSGMCALTARLQQGLTSSACASPTTPPWCRAAVLPDLFSGRARLSRHVLAPASASDGWAEVPRAKPGMPKSPARSTHRACRLLRLSLSACVGFAFPPAQCEAERVAGAFVSKVRAGLPRAKHGMPKSPASSTHRACGQLRLSLSA